MKFITKFLVVAQSLSFTLGQECVCTDQVTIVQTVTQTSYTGNPTRPGSTVEPGSNSKGNGPATVTITETQTLAPTTVTETVSPATITETTSPVFITKTITLTSIYKPTLP